MKQDAYSEARRAASRANGAKSRGPVTPEGKQRSSRNAVKHALLASALTLSGEEAEFFESYHARYAGRLEPRDQFESDCVEQIAYANYRLRLAWQMHDRTLAIQMANDRPAPAGVPDPFPKADRLAMAFANSLKGGTALPTLHRYMRQLTNDVKDAFRMYETLRSRPIPLEPSDEFPNEPEPEPEPDENDRFPPSGIEPGPAQSARPAEDAPETGTPVENHPVGAMSSSEVHGSGGLTPDVTSAEFSTPDGVSAPSSPRESPWFSQASASTAPQSVRSSTEWPARGSPSITPGPLPWSKMPAITPVST